MNTNWINKAKKLKINEVNSFIRGMQSDYDSIINAINYKYNNGLAEGSVNKIKTIKRIMYGLGEIISYY
jgi:transposase